MPLLWAVADLPAESARAQRKGGKQRGGWQGRAEEEAAKPDMYLLPENAPGYRLQQLLRETSTGAERPTCVASAITSGNGYTVCVTRKAIAGEPAQTRRDSWPECPQTKSGSTSS